MMYFVLCGAESTGISLPPIVSRHLGLEEIDKLPRFFDDCAACSRPFQWAVKEPNINNSASMSS